MMFQFNRLNVVYSFGGVREHPQDKVAKSPSLSPTYISLKEFAKQSKRVLKGSQQGN